jgi:hypothetical protein
MAAGVRIMKREAEPSTFALDLYFASGRADDPSLEEHVASCQHCAAYLSSLERLCGEPAWHAAPPRSRRGLGVGILAAACAGIAVAVWLSGAPDRQAPYLASKGVPAVQALIRDQSGSRVWDGKTPIRAGDAIALRAGCDRFVHVAVLVASAGGEQRVFDGTCPSGSDPLPFTLLADDKPGVERIHVIFSQERLDDPSVSAALRSGERDTAVWVDQLLLRKAVGRP